MNNEIKEIKITFPGQILDYVDTKEHLLELFNYITNLQEELDRCVKANVILDDENAELQGENQKLKELCDKYEEEHSTEFKIWKDERHQLLDYKSRNEKYEKVINEIKEKPIPDNTIEIDVNKLKTSNIKLNKIFKEKDDWFIEYYDIKEILSKMERLIVYGQYNAYYDLEKQLLDNITNLQEELERCIKANVILDDENAELQGKIYDLQEKSNNQAEEINRLYKQREKFMKKYGYLQKENERLKKELNALRISEEEWLNETLGGDEE